eukprot:1144490-Pelagomonas_calceolata.AAC.2
MKIRERKRIGLKSPGKKAKARAGLSMEALLYARSMPPAHPRTTSEDMSSAHAYLRSTDQ